MALRIGQARRQAFSAEAVVTLVGIGIALSLLGDATLYVVLPTHTAQAGILLEQVGLMLSANRLIRIFINSPFGLLIERWPRRPIMVVSLFLGAVASLFYTVPGFAPLLIGRLVWGIAWAGMWIGATTMILDIAGFANRGRMVGRLQMWFFIGVSGSSLLGGILTDALGYTATFLVSALVVGAGAVLWLLLLPEMRPAAPAHPKQTVSADEQHHAQVQANRNRLPLMIAITLYGLNWLLFIGALTALLPVLVNTRLDTTLLVIPILALAIPPTSFTGILTALNTVISLLTAPLSGWLSDRGGRRWWLVVFAVWLGILTLSVAAVGRDLVIIAATFTQAVVTSILTTQAITLAGDYAAPERRGRVLGVMNTVGDIGGALGPLLAFALLPVIGIEGIFTLGALLLTLVFPPAVWAAVHEGRINPTQA